MKKDMESTFSDKILKDFLRSLQVVTKCSDEEDINKILKKANRKIGGLKWQYSQCRKVAHEIIIFLRQMTPSQELEELCITVLATAGSWSPYIIEELLDKGHHPPRGLLVAVRNICDRQGTIQYTVKIWDRILHLLPISRVEEDTLATFQLLKSVITCVPKHVNLRARDEEEKQSMLNDFGIKASNTILLLKDCQCLAEDSQVTEEMLSVLGHLFFLLPLPNMKDQVKDWITDKLPALLSTDVTPVCISECVRHLLRALQQHGTGGFDTESQVDDIMALLLKQLNRRDEFSDTLFEKTEKITFHCLHILTSINSSRVLHVLKMGMLSEDQEIIVLSVKVFMKLLRVVPPSDEVKREVVQATITLLQQDPEPPRLHLVVSGFLPLPPRTPPAQVQEILLDFIAVLIQQDYLVPPEGNNLLIELMQMIFNKRSVRWGIRKKCSEVLKKVSLAKLITVVCHPENHTIFVPMSEHLLIRCRQEWFPSHFNYFSSYHQSPTHLMSPQELLINLLQLARNPYLQTQLGRSSLMLLSAVQPLSSPDPVINTDYSYVFRRTITQLLNILLEHDVLTLKQQDWENELLEFSGRYLTAVNNDDWLEQLLQVLLERLNGLNTNLSDKPLSDIVTLFETKITFGSQESNKGPNKEMGESVSSVLKAFLYKLFGFALCTVNTRHLVESMVISLLQTSHKDLHERKGIAEALSVVSRSHLEVVLVQLKTQSAVLTDMNSSPILNMAVDLQSEWGLVCDTIYSSFSRVIEERKDNIKIYVDDILALTIANYKDAIAEKDTTLKMDYLNALSKITTALRTHQLMDSNTMFPHAQELVILMMRLLEEEPVESISSLNRLKALSIITAISYFEEEEIEALYTCFRSVLSLPASAYRLYDEGSDDHLKDYADIYRNTLQSFLNLVKKLVAEKPCRIERFLEILNDSLNSRTNPKWERAMWCASHILEYVEDMNCFRMEITFNELGHLLKLLTLGCHDDLRNVFSLSSQALNHLYRILLQQKRMRRMKLGLGEEDGIHERDMADMNYYQSYDTSAIGQVFAEFFTETQLTTFLLDIVEDQKGSEVEVSLTALQLMNAILKEWSGNLMQSEHLISLAPLILRNVSNNKTRVTVESIVCLMNVMNYASAQATKDIFCTIEKDLYLLMREEREEVRIAATATLGTMLKRIHLFKLRSSLKNEIRTFILPLLLNFQEENLTMVQVCAETLEQWAKVMGWSSLNHKVKNMDFINPKWRKTIEKTIKHLVLKRKGKWLGRLLSENLSFIQSPQPSVRIAAHKFIEIILKALPEISEEDSAVIETALEETNESDPSIQILKSSNLSTLHQIPAPQMRTNCISCVPGTMFPCWRRSKLFSSKKKGSGEAPRRGLGQTVRGSSPSIVNTEEPGSPLPPVDV